MRDQNKQDADNEDTILVSKLANVLKNSAIQQGMQNKKERKDKVMTKGNPKTTHNRSKLIFKCELCTFEAFKLHQLKKYVRIHTKQKMYNCEICQYKFRLKYHILCHKRRKHLHENRLSCKCCGK